MKPIKPKNEPKQEGNGPADSVDDGKKKPWHSEDGWQYSWYYNDDEEEDGDSVFDHLDEQRDYCSTAGNAFGGGLPENGEEPKESKESIEPKEGQEDEGVPVDLFEPDDDEDDRKEKLRDWRLRNMDDAALIAYFEEKARDNARRYSNPLENERQLKELTIAWISDRIGGAVEYQHMFRFMPPYIRALRLLVKDEAEFQDVMKNKITWGVTKQLNTKYFNKRYAEYVSELLALGAQNKRRLKKPCLKKVAADLPTLLGCSPHQYFHLERPFIRRNPDIATIFFYDVTDGLHTDALTEAHLFHIFCGEVGSSLFNEPTVKAVLYFHAETASMHVGPYVEEPLVPLYFLTGFQGVFQTIAEQYA